MPFPPKKRRISYNGCLYAVGDIIIEKEKFLRFFTRNRKWTVRYVGYTSAILETGRQTRTITGSIAEFDV